MNVLKRSSLLFAFALLLALTGCATERKAVGEFFDDAGITTRVKKAIYDEPSLKVTQISVKTEDNVVHLSGTVGSRAEAAKAAEVARSVRGVRSVRNDLQVKQ
jgi:hyperosmotically inducible periplasmic protein